MMLILELVACAVLVGLGAFFSGSETGVYRASRVKIRLGVEQRWRRHQLLHELMQDSHAVVFSILIGNNLVNYLATVLITLLLLRTAYAQSAELLTTLVMTPVLFVFSEVIPKNVYYYRADEIMPRLSPVLWTFHKLFRWTGAVRLLEIVSLAFARVIGASPDAADSIAASRREHIKKIIEETREEGILSSVQQDIMNRLIAIPSISVGAVMIPEDQVVMLDVQTNVEGLRRVLRDHPHTRYPVYEKRRTRVIGFINIYDVLMEHNEFSDLRPFVEPMPKLRVSMGLLDAIEMMQKNGYRIVQVTPDLAKPPRGNVRPAGIVTMKDLVEELTGELVQW